jgi:imidazolonepropionase
MPDLAVVNAGELVTCREGSPDGGLGIIEDGALLVERGKVAWVGTTKEYRRKTVGRAARMVDAGGVLVTPGFVDPHTHLLFAGSREDELERKVAGESYTEILRAGGGIARTVRDTRRAPTSQIIAESKSRILNLERAGVTTAEVKTGYGQNLENELRMLDALHGLRREVDIELVPTFLGLHAKPPEFKGSSEYVDYAAKQMLPEVAKRKDKPEFSDCFLEEGFFSKSECSRYLRASAKLGFKLKVHADEFGDSGGASLAGELRCVSADHLGKSSKEGFGSLAKNGVTAVLLPGTSFFSGIPYADAKGAMAAGCTVALGTDLSPNSWIESPQLVMSLACIGMKLTPAQALLGFTKNAARALGREDIGVLKPGSAADFLVHKYASYRFLPYQTGGHYVSKAFKRGREVYRSEVD